MSLWARESASRTEKPSSRSMAATALLPLAIPPVSPSRSIFPDYRALAVDCVAENFGEARRRRGAFTVLVISMVMVVGARPPGQGLSAPAVVFSAGWPCPAHALPFGVHLAT